MNIALIGTGKMGLAIEPLAVAAGHNVILKIGSQNKDLLQREILSKADIAIEFTRPDAAVQNLIACLEAGIPVVSGTTGWQPQSEEIFMRFRKQKGTLLTASNFSTGVNMLFEMNRILAGWMNNQTDYKVSIEEVHHIHKLDKPSGTAVTLADDIIKQNSHLYEWYLSEEHSEDDSRIPVVSVRKDDVTGDHTVEWKSSKDRIVLRHEAFSRESFAQGALRAAEWLIGKTGVYTYRDVLFPGATSNE